MRAFFLRRRPRTLARGCYISVAALARCATMPSFLALRLVSFS